LVLDPVLEAERLDVNEEQLILFSSIPSIPAAGIGRNDKTQKTPAALHRQQEFFSLKA